MNGHVHRQGLAYASGACECGKYVHATVAGYAVRPHVHWSTTHPADGPCTECGRDVVRVAIHQYVEWPQPGPVRVPETFRDMR